MLLRWCIGFCLVSYFSATPLNDTLVFSAELGGWHVDVRTDALWMTWKHTGMVWRSRLFDVTSRLRTAKNNLGGWSHTILEEHSGALAVVHTANQPSNTTIALEGDIKFPSGTTELWTLQLLYGTESPETIDFKLQLNCKSCRNGAVAVDMDGSSQCRSKRFQECYTYRSTDVRLSWELSPTATGGTLERIVGAGEQFSSVDLVGKRFDVWSGEQGIGRGRQPITPLIDWTVPLGGGDEHTTYSAVPALLSTRGYGLALTNTQLVRVDLTSGQASLTVSFENRPANSSEREESEHPSFSASGRLEVAGHIFAGDGIRSMLGPLTKLTGRMSAPPAWVLDGLVLGAEGGHELVQSRLDAVLSAGVAVSGVWIQDWSGMVHAKAGEMVWWNWELDEARYPIEWLQSLNDRGIRVLTYLNPMLAAKGGSDGRQPKVFMEAKRLGHLIKDTSGEPIVVSNSVTGVPYGQVDLQRNESWQWWVNLMRCNVMLACHGRNGKPLVHGWMHDYAEQLWLNASVPQSLGVASDVHNAYPQWNAAAAFTATDGFPNTTYFARSGALKSPGSTRMFWLGDQLTSYDGCDGLQSAVIGAMSGGMSGWTVTHTDLGGFTMVDEVSIPGVKFVRDSELLVRWLEVGAFINSMYRSHPGLQPNSSSQLWDADVLGHTKNLTDLFRALLPYRTALLNEATQSGLPPVRHGLLVYPEDPTWFEYRDIHSLFQRLQCGAGNEVGLQQFFFGDDLLVAPVFASGLRNVKVYIPEGKWAHLWSGKTVLGPRHVSWPAPLGRPVAFYRASSNAPWSSFFHSLGARLGEGHIETVPVDLFV